ncbi:MAG: LD-carboxypeptidase [Bacteroidota bacterium]
MHRRDLLRAGALSAAAAATTPAVIAQTSQASRQPEVIRPARLREGQTVGLVSPAGIISSQGAVEVMRERFARLGLRIKVADHVLDRHGYFAGSDRDRAEDVAALFADDDVDAVVATTGGWGCARILPYLDYDVIRQNPKVLAGFSDVTALLLAVHGQTGLATIHGPNGMSRMRGITGVSFRQLVMDGVAATIVNPPPGDLLEPRRDPPDALKGLPAYGEQIRTVQPGRATGRLIGGNLTVMSALVGTPWLPDTAGHILFVEDIAEAIYRVDRMLTQLGQAGVLDGLAGFVFGVCQRCYPDSGDPPGFSLDEVIEQHIRPLGIPAYTGAQIGHTADKLTVPIGIETEIDADAGTLRLLAPAVL